MIGVDDDVFVIDRPRAITVSPFRPHELIAGLGRVAHEHAPAPLWPAADLLDEPGQVPMAVIVSVEQLGGGQRVGLPTFGSTRATRLSTGSGRSMVRSTREWSDGRARCGTPGSREG